MTPPHLHVLAIDPGETSGWCLMTVPRACIFGAEPSEVWSWDTGEIKGTEPEQAIEIARMAREAQSLDYLIGPAIVIEDFDIPPHAPTTDPVLLTPVRLAAAVGMLVYLGRHSPVSLTGDATVTLQGRTIAKQAMTDDRLRRSGYWVEGSDHERDAVRHAITALRRAREKRAFREELWPSPNGAHTR